MSKRPLIAVDIDDVLGDELEAIRQFANSHKGFTHTPEDYRVEGDYWGYWFSVWGVDAEEGRQIYDTYVAAGLKNDHTPLKGAIEAIVALKKNYDIVVITARGEQHVEPTVTWLKKHFKDAFKGVEFMPLWGDRMVITKAQIAQHHGATYLIDDNYEHCLRATEAGIETLLFGDYGWNRSFETVSGMTRVADWSAVRKYFDV